jgi:hypothetical protein
MCPARSLLNPAVVAAVAVGPIFNGHRGESGGSERDRDWDHPEIAGAERSEGGEEKRRS